MDLLQIRILRSFSMWREIAGSVVMVILAVGLVMWLYSNRQV